MKDQTEGPEDHQDFSRDDLLDVSCTGDDVCSRLWACLVFICTFANRIIQKQLVRTLTRGRLHPAQIPLKLWVISSLDSSEK